MATRVIDRLVTEVLFRGGVAQLTRIEGQNWRPQEPSWTNSLGPQRKSVPCSWVPPHPSSAETFKSAKRHNVSLRSQVRLLKK